MRVFLQEWKKIWRPGILVALLVLGLAYFYLFSNFYIEYFCNGPTAQAEFDLASEWVETYGPTMEPEERQALDQQLEEEKATFARRLRTMAQRLRRGSPLTMPLQPTSRPITLPCKSKTGRRIWKPSSFSIR